MRRASHRPRRAAGGGQPGAGRCEPRPSCSETQCECCCGGAATTRSCPTTSPPSARPRPLPAGLPFFYQCAALTFGLVQDGNLRVSWDSWAITGESPDWQWDPGADSMLTLHELHRDAAKNYSAIVASRVHQVRGREAGVGRLHARPGAVAAATNTRCCRAAAHSRCCLLGRRAALQTMKGELKSRLTLKWMFACGASWAWEASNLVSLHTSGTARFRMPAAGSCVLTGLADAAAGTLVVCSLTTPCRRPMPQMEHLNRKVQLRLQIQKPFKYCDTHNVLASAAPSFSENIERMVRGVARCPPPTRQVASLHRRPLRRAAQPSQAACCRLAADAPAQLPAQRLHRPCRTRLCPGRHRRAAQACDGCGRFTGMCRQPRGVRAPTASRSARTCRDYFRVSNWVNPVTKRPRYLIGRYMNEVSSLHARCAPGTASWHPAVAGLVGTAGMWAPLSVGTAR